MRLDATRPLGDDALDDARWPPRQRRLLFDAPRIVVGAVCIVLAMALFVPGLMLWTFGWWLMLPRGIKS